MHMTGIESSN